MGLYSKIPALAQDFEAGLEPMVTIAIPTFNRAALVRDCVLAALSQTYPRFEVLVSDNASSDETQQVLAEFDDPRVRVIRQETNISLLPNWNACVDNAKGDYIVVVPDDDRIAPGFLEQCVGLIRQQPQLPIVVALSNVELAEVRRVVPGRASRSLPTGIRDGTDVLMEFLTGQITVTMCSILMRTEILRARGGIPLDLPHTADVAAWAPLLLIGKAGFVNQACATFTHHNESETARLSIEQLLGDGSRVAQLIAELADRHVADAPTRQRIQLNSRRCFARRGLIVLSDFRKSGGSLQKLANFAWQFRSHLRHVDVRAVLRLLAIAMCPRFVADQFRQFRRTMSESSA